MSPSQIETLRTRAGRSIAALALLAGCAQPAPILLNRDLWRDAPKPIARSASGLGPETPGRSFDHRRWDALLAASLNPAGAVDYAALKKREPEVDAYLVEIGNVPLDELSRHEQCALLINAFNACTIKMILEHPETRVLSDLPASRGWRQKGWVIDRVGVSLEELEQVYLRRRFPDPRLHFALVRGARGSPPLRGSAYSGAELAQELEEQARLTLSNPAYCAWNETEKRLRLGGFLERYQRDFADSDAGLIKRLMPWMPSSIQRSLKTQSHIQLEFAPFDWRLNGDW